MLSWNIIVAMDEERGIGKDGGLPWRLSADLKHFRELTTRTQDSNKKNAVVMGRKTWESLPESFRPLPGRMNFVLTRDKNFPLPEHPEVCRLESLRNIERAFQEKGVLETVESVFWIGGGEIFESVLAMRTPRVEKIFVTHIQGKFDCDTFFPPFQEQFERIVVSPAYTENQISFYFAEYRRR